AVPRQWIAPVAMPLQVPAIAGIELGPQARLREIAEQVGDSAVGHGTGGQGGGAGRQQQAQQQDCGNAHRESPSNDAGRLRRIPPRNHFKYAGHRSNSWSGRMQPDFKRMAVFRTVVAQGGVNAAARVLHKSPSAVTYDLQQLERQLGTQLFRKSGRRLLLTPRGRSLAASIERACLDLQQAWERFDDASAREPLRIA